MNGIVSPTSVAEEYALAAAYSNSSSRENKDLLLQQHGHTVSGCIFFTQHFFTGRVHLTTSTFVITKLRSFGPSALVLFFIPGIILSYGVTVVSHIFARSQQKKQVIATGKSNRVRPVLPSISPYWLAVRHLTRPTLLDCLADILLLLRLKRQDTCDTTATYFQ